MNKPYDLDSFQAQYSKTNSVEEAFLSFSRNSIGERSDLDLLLTLQSQYRRKWQWDHNFHLVIEAGGYLGQKYSDISKYIFERIISDELDETDQKYFLCFCLTLAALNNKFALRCLWKLRRYQKMEGFERWADARSLKDEKCESKIVINNDVSRGLADSWKLVEIASPEVIRYIFTLIKYFGDPPPLPWNTINKLMGDSPSVKCQIIEKNGNPSVTTHYFGDDAIPLLLNCNLHKEIDFIYRWCETDPSFKQKVIIALNDIDTSISYVTLFLKAELRKNKHEISDPPIETLLYSARKSKKEFVLEEEIESLKNFGAFLAVSINRLENKETRIAEYTKWKEAAQSTGRGSLAWTIFDFIEYTKFNLLKRVDGVSLSRTIY
jgi:hypothetical protein